MELREILKRLVRVRELALLAVVLATGAALAVWSPSFLTASNLWSVAIGFAPEAVVCAGMTILIVSGGFDLSVGALMALCGVVAGLIMREGYGIALGAAGGLALGGACGLINGLVVTRIGVNPLIATLGMMSVARGMSLVITQGYSVTDLPPHFKFLGEGVIGFVPVSVLVMAVIVAAGDLCLRKHRFFRQVYYIGGNERAARFSGIKVDQVRTFTYVLSGLLSAFGGIMLASRLMTATPMAGQGVELKTISAAVIGGASLAGGEGTVLGGFLGIIFMALISNALTLLDVSLYWHGVVLGAVLIGAVSLDMMLKKRR